MDTLYSLLDPLVIPLTWLLEMIHTTLGVSWGWSIVVLTVLVRIAMIPLTVKQQQSFRSMQALQPEIKKLQAKYKDNRQKLNEETMLFYKENKVNPFGSCLPLLVQLPIFFALFFVPRRLDATRALAFAGALMIGFQLVLTHWMYLYLPWVMVFLAIALLAPRLPLPRQRRRTATPAVLPPRVPTDLTRAGV